MYQLTKELSWKIPRPGHHLQHKSAWGWTWRWKRVLLWGCSFSTFLLRAPRSPPSPMKASHLTLCIREVHSASKAAHRHNMDTREGSTHSTLTKPTSFQCGHLFFFLMRSVWHKMTLITPPYQATNPILCHVVAFFFFYPQREKKKKAL